MPADLTYASLLASAAIAYLLGAIPIAYIAGRLYGVNIFAVGTRQAGATNVWRNVSHRAGITVFFIDSTKGLLGVLAGRWLGVDGAWLLLPSSAIIIGHWNSPFTRFRGGDGVSSLTGIGLGLMPLLLLPSYILIAFITLGFNSRLNHPTLWGAVSGYVLFLLISFSPYFRSDPALVLGMTALGIAILLHSLVYHRRHIGDGAYVESVGHDEHRMRPS